ncbi:hypothetical protein MLD38_039186 [Melastoma candidum]|uniref:Uncharacterized protein n=1 Tax=Melastoma candidum TaxID=119954 RepID=A0ACB9L2U1_9MYRT|nr:hypothetical protein MLD38_039186 [Melastoma candidum]
MGLGGSPSSTSTSSRLRRAVRKMVVAACASFSRKNSPVDGDDEDRHRPGLPDVMNSSALCLSRREEDVPEPEPEQEAEGLDSPHNVKSKSLCAICLDPLCYGSGSSPGHAVFTAQCSHSFHFACISSNVSHGNITCPICRAHWTQLPRNLSLQFPLLFNQNDPILRILDDSIATFRVHRRSFLRSARYDDDDPVEPDDSSGYPRLDFTLTRVPPAHSAFLPNGPEKSNRACLTVRLVDRMATDLVLVASPNGPHLRLLKQSMALVVFSLRPTDRLAIVSYSSAAARVFPLRRMTSYGKKTALQVIDRLFYMGHADPIEGLKKGIKILEDRVHKNPQAVILHLSDCPMRSYHSLSARMPIPIHRFHVGFGFGSSSGFVMHEFEEFLARLLGGVVREVQVRVGGGGRALWLGELRCGDERQVMLELDEDDEEEDQVCVGYSYAEGWDGYMRTGEAMLSIGDKTEAGAAEEEEEEEEVSMSGGGQESWEYHDPCMARRWAKHLHGYRL